MKSLRFLKWTLLAFGSLSCASRTKVPQAIICKVSIVGGGAAGTYMAYRLAEEFKGELCLFERESELGGRLRDELFSSVEGGQSFWVGTGARRVNEVQTYVKNLARDLKIELQSVPERSQIIQYQGKRAATPDAFIENFPGLIGPLDRDPSTTREDEIYAYLLKNKKKAKASQTLRSFIEELAGPQAFSYLRAVSRFHGDFDYEVSARHYLDVLEEEFKIASKNLYPVGGMGAFTRGMEKHLREQGVRIFLSDPLLSFDRRREAEGFELFTAHHQVATESLVLAVPPSALKNIQGPLADQLKASPEYQAFLPIPVVVINMSWQEAWWKNLPPLQSGLAPAWRAWSRDHCVTHTEIPQESYLQNTNAIRAVYTEDPKCVEFWQELYKRGGEVALEAEVLKGLETLWGLEPKSLPKPKQSRFHLWSGGWYYIHPSTSFSTQDLMKWSQEPLRGERGLMLVGEAYWITRPGWSEGAYFSADKLLKDRFFDLK